MTKPRQLRIVAVYLIPLLATMLYLCCTIIQIMGQESRYYLPYCPYLIFPAMMVLDEALVEGERFQVDNPLFRLCLTALLFSVIGSILPDRVIRKLDYLSEGRKVRYVEAQRMVSAKARCPLWSGRRVGRTLPTSSSRGFPGARPSLRAR